MHKIAVPQWAIERVTARHGRRHVFAGMVPARTALLVVDMQNAFLMGGVAHNLVPEAREIDPNINRLAAARTDAEHNAALSSLYVTSGDVLSTEEILEGIASASKVARPHQVAG